MSLVALDEARRRPQGQRVPPHDLAAERALLGAVLISRDAIDDSAGLLTPEDFYKPAHAHIWQACQQLSTAGEPVDQVTVAGQLERNGLTEATGGLPELAALITDTPSTRNAESYARNILHCATLRRLIAAAGEIAELGYNQPDDLPAALDRAENLVFNVATTGRHQQTGPEHASTVIARTIDNIEHAYAHGGAHGTPTGFVDLDERILGLHPGQLVTICARPGMGKTALGTQIALNAAMEAPTNVLFASVEMSPDEIAGRLLSSESKVDLHRIRSAHLAEKDWPRLSQAVARIADSRLWFLDAATTTITTLRSDLRRLAARNPVGLLVVDYLQLMHVDDRRDNRQVDVSQISQGLKRIAREFNIPVVALAQLSRNVEMRADKRPVLSDLRESGAIENDSDVVIGIYRDDYYNPESADRGTAELIVLKQRSGPTGKVQVAWLDHYTRFANMARV